MVEAGGRKHGGGLPVGLRPPLCTFRINCSVATRPPPPRPGWVATLQFILEMRMGGLNPD